MSMMPPPLLPEKVLLLTVTVPRLEIAAAEVALLPEKVLLLTVSVPQIVDAAAVAAECSHWRRSNYSG